MIVSRFQKSPKRVFPLYILLFLMLFAPYEYQMIKGLLLVYIILTVVGCAFINGRIPITGKVLIWYLVLICNGLLFVFWGYINGYSDAIKVLPVYVIWPMLYLIITGSVLKLNTIENIFRLFIFSSLAICLYSLLYVLSNFGIVPHWNFLYSNERAAFSISRDFISYFTPSITSMLYLVPFMASASLLWHKTDNMPVKPLWLNFTLLLSIVTMIFTSRRTFWIILLLAPAFTLLMMYLVNNNYKDIRYKIIFRNMKKICMFFVSIFLLTSIIYFHQISDLIDHMTSSSIIVDAATFQDDGTIVRQEQFKGLMESWSEAPILGAGHGASSPLSIRSEESPWMYELAYVALLFQTGIVGFTVYSLVILWVFYKGIKISRHDVKHSLYILPPLVGMSCFLVANATNTYLQAYDHLWTIFIPIMLINYFMKISIPVEVI